MANKLQASTRNSCSSQNKSASEADTSNEMLAVRQNENNKIYL